MVCERIAGMGRVVCGCSLNVCIEVGIGILHVVYLCWWFRCILYDSKSFILWCLEF